MKHFKVQELVSESVYNVRGERSIQLIDNRITTFLDELREALQASITCNDWLWGGKYSWRGLRTSDSEDFSQYSQHTFGRAIDFKVKGMSAEEVRQWIIKNRNLWWVKPISFIEGEVSWVHVDVRNLGSDDIWLWGKKSKETTVYKRS